MKKLCKDIFWIITIGTFVIIATYSLLKIFDKEFKTAIYIEISIAIIIACFRIFYKKIVDVFNKIFYRGYEYKKEYNDKEIRLSFAYLIRIRINGKYLLIKSKRDKYQPVGGVYHIDDKAKINDKFGFYRDSHPGDANDIRGNILGRNIKKFIKWFNKKTEREITPDREFREELIASELLPSEIFSELNFSYFDTFYKGVNHDNFYNTLQLLRFDIFDFIPTKEQERYLENLDFKNKKIKANLYLATNDEIKRLGVSEVNDKQIFGTQTPFILEGFKNE